MRIAIWALALVIGFIGVGLFAGGILLVHAGGSAYYPLAGAGLIATAIALARRRPGAAFFFAAVLVGTLLWSLWEVGFDGWPLAPRLTMFIVLSALFLVPPVRRAIGLRRQWLIAVPMFAMVLALLVASMLAVTPDSDGKPTEPIDSDDPHADEWLYYGRTLAGTRYSPLSQIDTRNVARLELAWQHRPDVPRFGTRSFQMTPLAANERLYTCADRNVVLALDPDTGEELWRFDPQVNTEGLYGTTCRGVSYFESSQPLEQCQRRILFGVADGRLMAVDADNGALCSAFGTNGIVDLRVGMGSLSPGEAVPTSPPAIVNGVAVIGQFINDFLSVDAPSGVVRGYDAVTGELRWVWDAGRPDRTGLPPEGESYTRNTPNAWTVFSGDESLGLVYVPTGNSLPDNFGSRRTPVAEQYASSIVAIDVATGKVRWSFRTVNHDLWDYDVASQPVLVELPDSDGATLPALIAPTKRGQLFVLDRRTGEPIDPVEQRPVPQGAAPGEWVAATQPYTTGFPSLAGDDLTEQMMWGLTPLDQLWCRIQFKRARYEGQFTPPSEKPSIAYPGAAGGSNWGSVTVDPQRGLLVANTLHIADIGVQLPPTAAANANWSHNQRTVLFPQAGFPYSYKRSAFVSPLDVPCQQPPYGRLSVFDLQTRQLVWSQSLGTAYRSGPFGIESHLPIRIGVPNVGGSIATAGGLIFIAATQDRFLRAYDIRAGKELWRAELPAAGMATPMTYRSKRTGRQYVLIAAGGHPSVPGPTEASFLAFALPTPAED